MSKKKSQQLINFAINYPYLAITILVLLIAYQQVSSPNWLIGSSAEISHVNVCFTPSTTSCSNLITQQINAANLLVFVQAYSFTSQPIAKALINAFNRKVEVAIILDKTSLHNKEETVLIQQLQQAGIPIYIDKIKGLAHNKIIIIDDRKVLTGSYNFTKGAEHRNAENIVLINDPLINRAYHNNWLKRKEHSMKVID
ncbi:phospholipase D-like domain-containing protein [Rickettsiales endosymbiont of Stachyamoeba lipophora]|uniref:phospholipase D-like domain-containing protein n=1 Tax=Rickettsiales endosymbiont of Stachyamoeba lipophora TaxID=2486578 RepID=UPI000F64761C|nr:phospholipase D-like domain-containing protein [Rickettsiales endosymbiont of Stachyamoeba lipophora]AZL15984.1 DUF1669 domain-containing protein [Rickettsiales endosymbiont of Stachyamoeba lipophora]